VEDPIQHSEGIALNERKQGVTPLSLLDVTTTPESTSDTDYDCPSLTGRTVERWGIQERLGRGGMGEVYRAQHVLLQQPVAIKRLAPAFRADTELRGVSLKKHSIYSP
jgi:hypothetical protein